MDEKDRATREKARLARQGMRAAELMEPGKLKQEIREGVAGAVGGVALRGIAAVGRGISQPPMMSLVSLLADEGSRGLVMGVFQSTASAARIVGPIAAGLLYDQGAAYPFWAAAGLTASGVILALGVPARASEAPAA